MVGLFGRNKVKEYVDISQRTGGKVRSLLRANKIVRLRKISATWRASGIDDSLDYNSGNPPQSAADAEQKPQRRDRNDGDADVAVHMPPPYPKPKRYE